jgi:hypothetical protein
MPKWSSANERRKTMKVHIIAKKKRTDEIVEGTFLWDGLADLYCVTTDTGDIAYVSVLDEVILWETA